MVLPPIVDHHPPPIRERNVLNIRMNDQGAILIEDQHGGVGDIREQVIRHVANCMDTYAYGCVNEYATSPKTALVSIKTSEETTYEVYIDVMDEVWMAYFTLWDAEARRIGFTDYKTYLSTLGPRENNQIKYQIPAQISIAEPDE